MTHPDSSSVTYWINKLFHSLLPQSFSRSEPRMRAWDYLHNLVVPLMDEDISGRYNLACRTDDRRPDSAQRLLTSARWDDKRIRRKLTELIAGQTKNKKNTFYIIETSFPKKGNRSAALTRQFSLDTGRLENCQVAVMLFCRTAEGRCFLIDCDLYVPRKCIEDVDTGATLEEDTTYRSKSQIAVSLVEKAIRSGLVPSKVLAALMCTDKTKIQHTLQARRIPHSMPLTALDLSRKPVGGGREAHESHWPPRSVARTHSQAGRVTTWRDQLTNKHYYYVYDPASVTCADVGKVVSELDQIHKDWKMARDCIRFDRYNVRSQLGWHRHMTLGMVAMVGWEMAREPKARSFPEKASGARRPAVHQVG